MKKKIYKFTIGALALISTAFLASCGKQDSGGGGDTKEDLSFSVVVAGGSNVLEVGKEYNVNVILETTQTLSYDPKFKFTVESLVYSYVNENGDEKDYIVDGEEFFNIETAGTGINKYAILTPIKATSGSFVDEDDHKTYTFTHEDVEIKVVGTQPSDDGLDKKVTKRAYVSATDATPAVGGYNYAANKYTADDKSTEILGKLEKYAMDNHLTGISLFEDSGYVRYSDRIVSPNSYTYVTNYGFGILSEGRIKDGVSLPGTEGAYKPSYYHTQSASNPDTINALNNQGSEVSSLYDYISTAYYTMRLDVKGKNSSEWYPVLASNIARQFEGPIASLSDGTELDPSTNNTSKIWKIYVKCKENAVARPEVGFTNVRDDKLTYATLSSKGDRKAFDGRAVSIDDYIYAFEFLLTGSHNFFRGSELAGDTTYGIAGAAAYYARTKSTGVDHDLFARTVGVKKGCDKDGNFITIELLNPVDQFTAMYTLSSNLYEPVPEEFVNLIGGSKYYGSWNGSSYSPVDNILSLAPYTLETWEDLNIDYKRNPNWQEFQTQGMSEASHVPNSENRYSIDGIAIKINKNAASDANAIYSQFKDGNVDSSGIPQAYLETDKSLGHETEGSSVFKLNVNSCTQEEWNKLFGLEGTNPKHVTNESDIYKCKPWMSNDNFIDGLNFSIDRDTFADKRGATGSNNYFSNSYMSDGKKGFSYNASTQHKEAMANYSPETHGYNITKAKQCFKKAVGELVNDPSTGVKYGTASNPTVLEIDIWWMYESDKTDYGTEIVNYFESTFNDPSVCGNKIKLKVNQEAVTVWDKVYEEHLQCGKFDLGFGAISGNIYNPLNFLEVLKSDDSSGFTLNWGTDTSVASPELEFDGKYWSFDALWAAADHGGIFLNGECVDNCKSFIKEVEPYNQSEGDLRKGADVKIEFAFADIVGTDVDKKRGVDFKISSVHVFPFGSANVEFSDKDITVETNGIKGTVTVHISEEKATEINELIRTGMKIKDTDKEYYFQMMYYERYWSMELHFTMKIGENAATEQYIYVARTEKDMEKLSRFGAVNFR